MGDEARIWIGGLPDGIREDEIRDEYKRFGTIKHIQIRSNNGSPSFAFVQFTDRQDAEDAVNSTDQAKLFGMPFVKVSWAGKGTPRGKGRGKGKSRSPRPRSPSPRRSDERPPRRRDSRPRPARRPSSRGRSRSPRRRTSRERSPRQSHQRDSRDERTARERPRSRSPLRAPSSRQRGQSPRGRSRSPRRGAPASYEGRSRSPRPSFPGGRGGALARERSRSRRGGSSGGPREEGGRGGSPGGRRGGGRSRSGPQPQRSYSKPRPPWFQPKPSEVQGKYRVKIEKLPEDMGWQELKGLGTTFAKSGQCTFARTNRDRSGVLEFEAFDDMQRAIDELDGRRFAGSEDCVVAYEDKSRR